MQLLHSICQYLTFVGLMACASLFVFIDSVIAAPVPPIYWHTANDGLPSDIQALTTASTTLYAGAWGEGVYRSTDHGATWEAANAGITLPLHIQGGLAVNPVTPTQVFAGDYYGGGLYRSENGGISWTLVLSNTAIRAVAVHPLTPTIVLVGDREEGLYRSADSGDTWAHLGAAEGLINLQTRALAFAPSAPDTAYAGAGAVIFQSTDAGQQWTVRGTVSSTVQALVAHPVTATLLYAGTFNDGVQRSVNGGATWTSLTNGLPGDVWVTSLALHPITPTILYAGTWDGQVYQTTDGGDSWTGLGYLGYVYDVLIHPQAPSVIYAATSNNGVFRGSTLNHLTIASIDSPQYVHRSFPITVTARDELGFPLIGPSQAELRRIARSNSTLVKTLAGGGYDGTAILLDHTETITPTLMTFADGVAVAEVAIVTEAASDVITATVSGGPAVVSNPFDVIWAMRLYLPVISRD